MSTEERQGDLIILSSAALWGLFPVITVSTYSNVTPLMSLALSTLLAVPIFAGMLFYKNRWAELKNLSALKDILITTILLGILFYVLFFFGLKYTSPGNASLIALTEVFFSFVFFNIWHKEHISARHIFGAVLMIAGAFIVLYPNKTSLNIGDLLILSAAFVAPMGNFFQRRARTKVNSETMMFVRSVLAFPVLLVMALVIDPPNNLLGINDSLPFLLVNGIVLFGLSKILWIEGIHRISVTKANALSSITPIITLFFAWLILKDMPTVWQLASFAPLATGMYLLTSPKYLTTDKSGIDYK